MAKGAAHMLKASPKLFNTARIRTGQTVSAIKIDTMGGAKTAPNPGKTTVSAIKIDTMGRA